MAKRRDAVGYTLPNQDDNNSNEIVSAEEASRQERMSSELRSRGAGSRNGPADESDLPSGTSSSKDPQGHNKPRSLDIASTSSSSYVPRSSLNQTQVRIQDPKRAHGFDRLEYEKVHEYVAGIPQVAAFINSSDHNAIFRRFGRLSARLLLQLQIEVTGLEEQLDELDNTDAVSPITKKRLRGYQDFDENDECQEDLLESIQEKLCQYFELLLYVNQVRGLEQAPKSHYDGLFTWIRNKHHLGDGPDKFIFQADDFVSVAKQSERGTRITDFLENLVTRWPNNRFFKYLMQTGKERAKIDDDYVDQYSPINVGRINRIIAVLLAISVLLIPVMLLFLAEMSKQAMAWLVFVFVLVFCVLVTVLTEARVLEIFVSTAAYTAVLVTFLGNLTHS